MLAANNHCSSHDCAQMDVRGRPGVRYTTVVPVSFSQYIYVSTFVCWPHYLVCECLPADDCLCVPTLACCRATPRHNGDWPSAHVPDRYCRTSADGPTTQSADTTGLKTAEQDHVHDTIYWHAYLSFIHLINISKYVQSCHTIHHR